MRKCRCTLPGEASGWRCARMAFAGWQRPAAPSPIELCLGTRMFCSSSSSNGLHRIVSARASRELLQASQVAG